MRESASKQSKKMQRMILRGPIAKTLFILGWPIMLTMFFQMAYNLIDTYWLGKTASLGIDPVEAVAAPSLAWPIVFLFISLASGLSVAGVALISQYTGAKDEEQVKKSAGQVMSLLTLMSIVISIVGILATDLVLEFMGADAALVEIASPYIKVIFVSMPFMFMMMTYSGILRGWGDMKTPMYIMAFSVILNIILDPVLIFGWGGISAYGVTGAAMATAISRSIGAVICVYLLFRGKSLTISLSHLKLEKERVIQIFRIGIPASIGQAMVAFGFVILMGFVAQTSTVVLAAYGIGNRVINMVFVLTGGLTGAAVTMIGQNLGAGRIKRAGLILKSTMAITAFLLFLCSSAFYIFRKPIFEIFIDDPEVIAEGGRFLMLFGMSILFFGVFGSIQSAFQASGHTVPSMILGIIRLWGLRVPLVFLLAFYLDWGATGIWIGMMLSNVISALIAVAWAAKGTWKTTVIDKGKMHPKITIGAGANSHG